MRHKAVPTPPFFTQCQDVTRLNEVFEGSPKRSFRNLPAYPAVDLWSRGVRKAFQRDSMDEWQPRCYLSAKACFLGIFLSI